MVYLKGEAAKEVGEKRGKGGESMSGCNEQGKTSGQYKTLHDELHYSLSSNDIGMESMWHDKDERKVSTHSLPR